MNRILIVDDNPKNIQVVSTILAQMDYEIEYAQNGVEAVEMLETDTFDLILMDIMMPKMDGYEACKRIKKMESKSEIPLIFLTSKTDTDSITEGFKCGGVDYIFKPFNSEELVARVRTHIELKANRDKLKNMNSILEQKVEERTKELSEANIKLTNANEELSVLDQAKSNFLKLISHEIRTPLNGILGFLELLKTRIEDDSLIVLLQSLESAAKRLEKFSYDALMVTDLKARKQELDIASVDINQLIEYQLLSFSDKISEKNLKINLDNIMQNLLIKTDNNLISEALKRILDNAIVYSEENSEIKVQSTQSDTRCTITIIDNGKGFKKEMLNKELKLLNPGEDHVDQNVGVDLYLTSQIMQTLNGKLEYGNNPDKGAYVNLCFNLK